MNLKLFSAVISV